MNGKQLKNSILQCAIQGKLVSQDPNDEPASVLLEKIRQEKERLIKEKKIKRDKNASIIYRGEDNSYYEKFIATGMVKCIDEEIPFEIPQGWEWCRISHLFLHASGKQQSISNKGNGTPQRFITTSNLYWGRFVLDNVKVMNFTDEEIKKCSATKGDLLVCEGGAGYGRSAIWDKDYDICLQNHVHRLRPYIDGICEYVYYFMYLLKESNQLASVGTAMPGLSANRLKGLLLPFPPISEQNKIVAKLGELFPQVEKYSKVQDYLDELNVAINDKLKQSILQEAIQGKLVPQGLTNESASVLLQRIKEEKQRLVKEGKLKKSALTDSVIFKGDDNKYYEQVGSTILDISEEIPFEEPNSWGWCRLKDICSIFTGATFKKEDATTDSIGIRIWRGGNIFPFALTNKPDDLFLPNEKVKDNILLQKNDIVTPAVTSLENIGKMARVESDIPNTTVGGFVFIIRPFLSLEILSQYLLALMSSPTLIEYMKSITNKSGQAFYNLGKERLGHALLPIPPLSEQERIVNKVLQTFDKIKG